MYLGAPFTFAALQQWHGCRRWFLMFRLKIISMALAPSSFSKNVWQLIVKQGFYVSYYWLHAFFALNSLSRWVARSQARVCLRAVCGHVPRSSNLGLCMMSESRVGNRAACPAQNRARGWGLGSFVSTWAGAMGGAGLERGSGRLALFAHKRVRKFYWGFATPAQMCI